MQQHSIPRPRSDSPPTPSENSSRLLDSELAATSSGPLEPEPRQSQAQHSSSLSSSSQEQWSSKGISHGRGYGQARGQSTSIQEPSSALTQSTESTLAPKPAFINPSRSSSLDAPPPSQSLSGVPTQNLHRPPPPPFASNHIQSQSSGLSRSRSSTKRSSSRQAVSERVMEPSPVKKARTGASPPRMMEIPASAKGALSVSAAAQLQKDGPTSPLFFSHTPGAKQSNRIASFQPTETAASLLARIREDPSGGVTTLKLPRGTVTSASPARSGSTPGSWSSSMDVSAPSLTPDSQALPSGLQMLGSIDIIDLLDQDTRPTFLVDLTNPANASRPGLHILFYNTSLRTSHQVLQLLTVDQDDSNAATDFGRFKAWIMSSVKTVDGHDLPLPTHNYGGIVWTSSTLRRRFRFVSGISSINPLAKSESPTAATETPAVAGREEDPSPALPLTPEAVPLDAEDYFAGAPRDDDRMAEVIEQSAMHDEPAWEHPDQFANEVLLAQASRATFDWTRIPLTENLPEHIRLARMTDWGATALGPIDDWPHDLRAMSNLVMGSPHPSAMYWGPEFVSIYNAAYIELAGQKHPQLMGARYVEAWSEIWDDIKSVFQAAWESGQATMKHDNQLFMNRNGYLEETFFSWSLVPLVGIEGEVVGLYNPAFENTRRKVTERRMLTLREIGERTAAATTAKGFWPQVRMGLEYNEFDVPFSLLYSVKDDNESEASSLHSGSHAHPPQLVLEGAIGLPEGHRAGVNNLDLRTTDEGFGPYMRQSIAAGGQPVVLSEELGNMPTDLITGLEWRGFGDPCRTIVVFPIVPTTAESVVGFIVLGLNPRRPYDDEHKLFVHLLMRQLATSMASVVLFEEEIKRGQRAARLAALDRQRLSQQLLQKSQEANESEYRFARMAEFAPVGMFIANSEGVINYCNDMWWQISRVSPSVDVDNAWMDCVRSEDRPALQQAWSRLLNEKVTISVEFRFKCSQQNGDHVIDTWVLMSAFPEKTPEGDLKSIFGCITDISSQKWAEKVQSERREEAVEMKRQQENFIDITSHEMRNPLSAILQCADQITDSISAFAAHNVREEVETLLEGCLDAANTINLCASHQKRIVDDILTLSKLDSNLLSVTPIDEQPIRVVQRALKMFEAELVAHDIEFEFRVDKSFEKHGIKWAKLDPSRLRQVLINLMTNAIKFTQTREKRSITVSLRASKDIAEVTKGQPTYFERNSTQRTVGMDINNVEEWGHGERINIHCTVEDTGPGLAEEELKFLFQRFHQATPRTHVRYGGSGLGLFISRILTEMQGGQIGVLSEPGVGSTFSFYIQSRISLDPPAEYEHISPFRIARKIQSSVATPPPSSLAPTTNTSPGRKESPLFDVLIVEDNIVNQKVLQRQLRSCGNNTFVANHGKEALQTLERSRFWAGQEAEGVDISVILMDLEMPVMDGMTCARRIRELEKEGTIVKHIPIIAVTAYARPEQIENAKAAGIDDVISKPFRIPELLPKIEVLVGKYQDLSISS